MESLVGSIQFSSARPEEYSTPAFHSPVFSTAHVIAITDLQSSDIKVYKCIFQFTSNNDHGKYSSYIPEENSINEFVCSKQIIVLCSMA